MVVTKQISFSNLQLVSSDKNSIDSILFKLYCISQATNDVLPWKDLRRLITLTSLCLSTNTSSGTSLVK